MFSQLFNWRTLLAIVAIAIVTGTIFYSNHLAKKIAAGERLKIEQWVEAEKDLFNPESVPTTLSTRILTENNKDIPMIGVNEKDSIIDHFNLDSAKVKADTS